MSNRFLDKLTALLAAGRAPLCVGLDPNPVHLPARYPDPLAWNRAIIAATAHLAACYKPNIAFYEALGRAGYDLLAKPWPPSPPKFPFCSTPSAATSAAPPPPTPAPASRSGMRTLSPSTPIWAATACGLFTNLSDRYVFVLCHTSNPSAAEIQWASQWGLPLYRRIAAQAMSWGDGNVGLVLGATYPETLAEVRAQAPNAWFLAPGVGAQGGDAAATLAQGARGDGRGVLINVSRGIALADDHAAAAQTLCEQMRLPPLVEPALSPACARWP